LGSDFVLLVYRDFLLLPDADHDFLVACWPSITAALYYLKTFDLDNDGIPENSGAPDQTFDDWRLQGISAYCGGLWIAALEAAIAMGQILLTQSPQLSELDPGEIQAAIGHFNTWLAQARGLYHRTLWNGDYYQLDSQSGSSVVMADQLCGQFYARLLNLPDVVEEQYATQALRKVYETCFLKFQNAQFGAANGLLPDGSPQNPNDTHPLEVWTGINFGLAAFLIQMGMKEEGLKLTETVINQIYTNGLQFRTPEAITAVGTFRASHYLRAMAIWAVYGLLEGFDNLPMTVPPNESGEPGAL
jgi:non-lysosomal glucosylceramidase